MNMLDRREHNRLSPDDSPFLQPGARRGLLLLFLLSLVLRLLWLGLGPQAIEYEGTSYARVGEDIATGRGFLRGFQEAVIIPHSAPYSALIAAGVRLGLTGETAGRVISLLFGSALPVVICLIGRRLYGPVAGWLGGLLAAVHPLLVVASAAVLTEPATLTLNMLAVYFCLGALDLDSRRDPILAGSCLGLSYLCRPEGLILAALFAITVVAVNLPRRSLALARAALLVFAFSVFALPYIVLLTIQTGQIRFEVKTPGALAFISRTEQGQDDDQINWAIDHDLVGTGIGMLSTRQLVRTLPSAPQIAWLSLKQMRLNLRWILRSIGAPYLGQPFIGMLAALGFFASVWGPRRLSKDLPLVAIVSLSILAAGTSPFQVDRYIFPLLPPMLVWGGRGLDWLRGWTAGTATECGLAGRVPSALAACMVAIWFALVSAVAVIGVRGTDQLSQSWTTTFIEEARLGKWLRTFIRWRAPVMDCGYVAAYYAGAAIVFYPWTDGDTASRYITKKNVEYLILRDRDRGRYPYFEELARSGLDGRAELIKTFHPASGDIVRVYRWRGKKAEVSMSGRPDRASPPGPSALSQIVP
jgi:Dolichyl-phosphate-mannose-protein mannosyltransferase